MRDLIYDLSPDEGLTSIEGHLLVLLMDDEPLSSAVADLLEEVTARLDDSSEFRLALVMAKDFSEMHPRALEFPALFHFMDGRLIERNHGVDDSVEFFHEFVDANRCKRNVRRN